MSRKQSLKQALRNNPIRALIVVDDSGIRLKAFQKIEKILKKINAIESKIQSFHDQDQRLFTDWFELTFRQERQGVEDLQSQIRELSIFHNRIIATARTQKIEMAEAYSILKKEKIRFEKGTPEEKEKIENAWRERDRFAQDQMEKEMREENPFFDFEENENNDGDVFTDENRPSSLSGPEKEEFAAVQKMSRKKIHRILADPHSGFNFLATIARWCSLTLQYRFLLEVWDLAPKRLRAEFSAVYAQASGYSFEEELETIRRLEEEGGPLRPLRAQEGEDEDTDESKEGYFDEDFFQDPRAAERHRPFSPLDEEKLKLTYRSLVRRLHPDMQSSAISHPKVWSERMWERVQKAYRTQDLPTLEHLLVLTILKSKDLSSLTLSEIMASEDWLQEDLAHLESESLHFKDSPAWTFSKRKSYDPLMNRIKKDFAKSLQSLQYEIDELQSQHEYLEFLSGVSFSKRKTQKSRAHRARPRKRSRSSPSQVSFF